MNKRIKELAEQAGWDGYEALDERHQRFAELIIEECISACATVRLGKTVGADELIKQRFGVEE